MKFDYNSLRVAANDGMKVGVWKNKNVFACSRAELETKGSGAYYIVYDDNNALVGRSSGGGLWKYGNVAISGNVNELHQSERYDKPQVVPEVEHISADFKMEMDVEAVLKQAREMTIDSLLEGFNYGLE